MRWAVHDNKTLETVRAITDRNKLLCTLTMTTGRDYANRRQLNFSPPLQHLSFQTIIYSNKNFLITTQEGTRSHCLLGYDVLYLLDRYYRRFDVIISTYKTEAALCSYQSTKTHCVIFQTVTLRL